MNSLDTIESRSEWAEIKPNSPPLTGLKMSLSEQLWGLDWKNHLPILGNLDGARLESSCPEDVGAFLKQNYALIFRQDNPFNRFNDPDSHTAKNKFFATCCDFFKWTYRGETIGVLICNPSDWNTYYFRFAAILPQFQSHGFLSQMFEEFAKIVETYGVHRCETETSPANFPVFKVLTRLQYNITGTNNTDRWGTLLRFTKFLNSTKELHFLSSFCGGVWPQIQREKGASP